MSSLHAPKSKQGQSPLDFGEDMTKLSEGDQVILVQLSDASYKLCPPRTRLETCLLWSYTYLAGGLDPRGSVERNL